MHFAGKKWHVCIGLMPLQWIYAVFSKKKVWMVTLACMLSAVKHEQQRNGGQGFIMAVVLCHVGFDKLAV